MKVFINDSTRLQVETDLISEEVVKGMLQNLEAVYLQTVSWLVGYPGVVAKNNTSPDNKEVYEKEQENLEALAKEKLKLEDNLVEIEAKIRFFKSLLPKND